MTAFALPTRLTGFPEASVGLLKPESIGIAPTPKNDLAAPLTKARLVKGSFIIIVIQPRYIFD
jgi:hypothetical protein